MACSQNRSTILGGVGEVDLSLKMVVTDFADAFKAVDASMPVGRSKKREYQPGIGPLSEEEAVSRTMQHLRSLDNLSRYVGAGSKVYPGSHQRCDLLIAGHWAIEFKLIRPFGDNGHEAEHWSENVLHPYAGNVSSIGDCMKLLGSGFPERKAIITDRSVGL